MVLFQLGTLESQCRGSNTSLNIAFCWCPSMGSSSRGSTRALCPGTYLNRPSVLFLDFSPCFPVVQVTVKSLYVFIALVQKLLQWTLEHLNKVYVKVGDSTLCKKYNWPKHLMIRKCEMRPFFPLGTAK